MKDYWSEEVEPYLTKKDYWAEEVAPFLEEEEELDWMQRLRRKLPKLAPVQEIVGGLVERGLEKWRESDMPISAEEARRKEMTQTEQYIANIGRQLHALPRFPIDIAEKIITEPPEKAIGTVGELAQYPFHVLGDYMTYISPLSSPEQRREAIEGIAEDPLGLFFAVGITKGGLKGGYMLKGAVKRARQKKGMSVEEPPAEKVPAITEEQIAKEIPKKEPVPGEAELKLKGELEPKLKVTTDADQAIDKLIGLATGERATKLNDIRSGLGTGEMPPIEAIKKAQNIMRREAGYPTGYTETGKPIWGDRGRIQGEIKKITESFYEVGKKKPVAEKSAEIPAEFEPGIMGGVSSIGQEASVQRVMGALKEAKPLRKEQEALYTKERGARLAKSLAIRKETTGEAGFYAEKGQFTGEMAKVTFESIRSKVSQTDRDNLFNKVKDNAYLTEFEKLTAREGLAKMFGEHGGRVPTKGELTLLEQVFPPEFIKTVMEKRPLWEKFKEAGWQLANIPRSVMASFDLSFGGRQGAYAAPRYRKQFWGAWKEQFKIFGSEKAYQSSRQALTKHPDFMLAKQSKVSFTELGKIMTQREEKFMSQWAEKIPIVGKGIRASSRAYTSFANKFRLDIFSGMVKDAEAMNLNPRNNPFLTRKIADFVNNATGRGSLGSFENAAVALNAIFFSPRLNMARLKLLNPALYVKRPKFIRTQALKTTLAASGTAVTILTLADLMGAEAGINPLSADFGKIKIGNTRIDMLAGFGQFMRAGAQLLAGKTISTVTGKETILGEGYKPRTRLDVFLQQVEYKESPIASFATTLLKGKDFAGRDVSIPKEVGKRFIPMVVADIVELAKEDPRLLPLGTLGIFGVGLQTYAHSYAKLVEIEKEYGYGIRWQQAKKELEDSGFKFNIKAYLEYKRENDRP